MSPFVDFHAARSSQGTLTQHKASEDTVTSFRYETVRGTIICRVLHSCASFTAEYFVIGERSIYLFYAGRISESDLRTVDVTVRVWNFTSYTQRFKKKNNNKNLAHR